MTRHECEAKSREDAWTRNYDALDTLESSIGKFVAEGNVRHNEARKHFVEGCRFYAEGEKFVAQRDRLQAKINKFRAEGSSTKTTAAEYRIYRRLGDLHSAGRKCFVKGRESHAIGCRIFAEAERLHAEGVNIRRVSELLLK